MTVVVFGTVRAVNPSDHRLCRLNVVPIFFIQHLPNGCARAPSGPPFIWRHAPEAPNNKIASKVM